MSGAGMGKTRALHPNVLGETEALTSTCAASSLSTPNHRRTAMLSVANTYAGDFLTAGTLPPGRRIPALIHGVSVETVGQGQAQKLALELVSHDGRAWPKKCILNKTNATVLAAAYGDDADHWTGKPVEIWQEPVLFQGRTVQGIRIAPGTQPPPAAVPAVQRPRGNGGSAAAIPDTLIDDEIPF